jgi:RimJ/RimL family protein N-acetyltransferase
MFRKSGATKSSRGPGSIAGRNDSRLLDHQDGRAVARVGRAGARETDQAMDLLTPRRGSDRGGEEGALRAAVNPALRIEPVVLAGEHVTLVPMAAADVEPLAAIGLDPELWRWIPAPVTSLEDMRLYVRTALVEAESGLALPFTIKSLATGETIGATRYANIRADDLGLEQSRRAIERLGATCEGVFRKHRRVPRQNRIRDTVYYSIIDEDWPRVKDGLLARLANP